MRVYVATLVALAGSLAAQNIVVGPTGAYNDIQTAVNAAPSGAVLLVQQGNYAPFTITQKSLTVIGYGSTWVQGAIVSVEVRDLLPGQRVSLCRLKLVGGTSPARLEVNNCQGIVTLNSISGSALGCQLRCVDSVDVRANESSFEPSGLPQTYTPEFYNSRVQLTDCDLDGIFLQQGIPVVDSTIELTNCTTNAGGFGSGAFLLQSSTMVLRGTTSVTSFWSPIFSGAGTVQASTTVSYSASTPGPVYGAGVVALTRPRPSVTATTLFPASPSTGTLNGPVTAFGWLFAGISGPATPLQGGGERFILGGTQVLMASGSLTGTVSASYPAPSDPALFGTAITWQGLCYDGINGLQVSNAASYVHF